MCGALVLGGLVAPAVGQGLSPRLTAALAACRGFTLEHESEFVLPAGWTHGQDAWGRPVRIETRVVRFRGDLELHARSLGPDGQQGTEDDLHLGDGEIILAGAVRRAPLVGVLLAAALAWCLAGPFTHSPRHPSRTSELPRALGLAAPPALLLLLVARAAALGVDPAFGDPLADVLDARATPGLLVSPRAAFLLTYATIALAVGYAWRITRPLEGEDAVT